MLHAALDTECGVMADGSVDASAEGEAKDAMVPVLPFLKLVLAVLNHVPLGAFMRQGLNVESLTVKRPQVLPTAHDEEGVLWVAQEVFRGTESSRA